MKVKWTSSLQTKYILLILLALIVLPMSIPLISGLVYLPPILMNDEEDPYKSYDHVESTWHEEAESLSGEPDSVILSRLAEMQKQWPDAGMFWVDQEGLVKERLNMQEKIPDQWSQAYTIQFMKDHFDSDPFTVVASVGEQGSRGWMVVQLEREHLGPPITKLERNYDGIIVMVIGVVFIGFITLSWIFFRRVHGRLKQLKGAMDKRGDYGLPEQVERTSDDEIGELEISFNRMVEELEESRQRERQEEAIRREWIASLSHDLRTPLTTIRASLNEVTEEVASPKGKRALGSINMKIDSLSHLIDNLLSLSLLTSHKYPYQEERVEMNRLIRRITAHWYAMFEQEGIEVEIDISENTQSWLIDPSWLERILDNLFQNVIRHAASGGCVAVRLRPNQLSVEDCGPGIGLSSGKEGAGVGLTIVDLMVRDMGLEWDIHSSTEGTEVLVKYIRETTGQSA